MHIQGLQPAQTVVSYLPSLRASAQGAASATTPAVGDVYSGERASRASAIMAGQDLTHISYNELKTLARRLYDAGVITPDQWSDLTAPNFVTMDAQMNHIAPNDDERINILAGLSAVLDAAKQMNPGDTSSIARMQNVVNLADSLDAISRAHQHPG